MKALGTGFKTVMVVDDDEVSNSLVSMYLSFSGHQVISASSGQHALDILAASPGAPDLILTDMQMPGMDGPQLVARLHATAKTEKIPVIVLSGLNAKQVDQARVGAQGYLRKPIHLDELTQAIGGYLS